MHARNVIATAGAGALALLLGTAGPAGAGAAGGDHTVTFTDGSGDEVTCLVNASSSPDTEQHTAQAQIAFVTAETPPDPRCLVNGVSVTATWKDADGDTQTASADGGSTQYLNLRSNGVESGYSAHHRIDFEDCSANCVFEVTTNPK